MTAVIFNTAGSHTWTCPLGVKAISLMLKGGGAPEVGNDGGGGGARIDVTALAVTAGVTYNFVVGAASTDTNWESGVFVAGGASGSTGGTPSGSGTPDDSSSGGDGGGGTGSCGESDNCPGGSGAAGGIGVDGLDGEPAGCELDSCTGGASFTDGTLFGNGGAGGNTGYLEINYTPGHLVFSIQPTDAFAGDDIAAQVTLLFSDNTTDTAFTGNVTITPNTGSISGTNPVAAVAGVADFLFSISTPDADYDLTASATDVTSAVSDEFDIFSPPVDIEPPPASVLAQLVAPTITAGVVIQLPPLSVQAQSVASLLLDAPIAMPPLQAIMQIPNFDFGYEGVVAMPPLAVEVTPWKQFADGGLEQTLTPLQAELQFAGNLSFAIEMVPMVAFLNPLGMLATAAVILPLKPLTVQPTLTHSLLSTDLQLSLQEVYLEEFPVETIYDLELELELHEVELETYSVQLHTITAESDTKFTEAVKSSASIIIFGSDPHEPFKFNPSASIYRRLGPSHIIHLGPAKPSFNTTEALFTLLTAFGELQPNEFFYEAPGGFLRIWNELLIQSSLIPDGDTAEIIITNATNPTNYPVPAITSLTAKRQF